MKLLVGSVLLCLALTSARENIAILDFSGHGLTTEQCKLLTESFSVELFKTQKFQIVERNNMQVILDEQGFQQTGCTSDECAVQIGKLLGVSKIVMGAVGQIGSSYLITTRLIDVATGRVEIMEKVQVRGQLDEVMEVGIPQLAAQLSNPTQDPPAHTSLDVETAPEPPLPSELVAPEKPKADSRREQFRFLLGVLYRDVDDISEGIHYQGQMNWDISLVKSVYLPSLRVLAKVTDWAYDDYWGNLYRDQALFFGMGGGWKNSEQTWQLSLLWTPVRYHAFNWDDIYYTKENIEVVLERSYQFWDYFAIGAHVSVGNGKQFHSTHWMSLAPTSFWESGINAIYRY